jgi:hypothetical protein
MKVVLKVVAVLALLVVIGVGAVVFTLARGGTTLDNWLAQQVVGIANYYLVPEIGFERFRYDAPGTLTLENATLTAPDGTVVVDATAIAITLARTPRIGEPIEISRVALTSPEVNLIQDESGGFKGLAPFVRQQRVREQDRAPSEVQLSNVLRIRKLTMTDGGMTFLPASGESPMELRGIALDLDVEPANREGETGAWYAIAAQANRAPILDFALQGRFDIDNLIADVESLSFETTLDENSYSSLPPQLQSLLRQYDARGLLAIDLRGYVPVRDFDSMDVQANVRVEDFNIAQGEYRLPIAIAAIDAQMEDGVGMITRGFADTLGGRVTVSSATIDLTAPTRPFNAVWNVDNVQLSQILRVAPTDEPPRFEGLVHAEGRIAGQADADARESLDGWGKVAIRKGRLLNTNALSQIVGSLNLVRQFSGRGPNDDDVDLSFEIDPEGVTITDLTIMTQAVAVRGAAKPVGVIRFDGTMNLLVNAGPLDSFKRMFGDRIGDIIGIVTDRLSTFEVSGPIGDTKVRMRGPLSVGSTGGR